MRNHGIGEGARVARSFQHETALGSGYPRALAPRDAPVGAPAFAPPPSTGLPSSAPPRARARTGWSGGHAYRVPPPPPAGTDPEAEIQTCRERLRSLSSALLRVEERERARLSMDLHDGLSQILVLTKIKLGALRKSGDPGKASAVLDIERLIDQAHQCVRSITFEMHPSTFSDLDLPAAVRWLGEHLGKRYGIAITVEDDGRSKALDPEHRTILLRSVRELLINAAKHARATAIKVRLRRTEATVNVSVEDDGVGMPDTAVRGGGFGLTSIRECLAQVGGSISVESRPQRGTKITVRAPWALGQRANPTSQLP